MSQPLSNHDFVIVGQQPWDIPIGSNCKDLALEFSKHHKVLYVNSPLDRFNIIKHRAQPSVQKRLNIVKGKEPSLVSIQPNLWTLYPRKISTSVSWIKNSKIFDFFNKRNNKRIAEEILIHVKALGLKNIILFNDSDIYRSFYLKEFLQPVASIYYSRDFMLGVEYWQRHGIRLEPQLIAKSDICVANSTYLAAYCRKYNPKSFYVGQGCEQSLFSKDSYEVPTDMVELSKSPVIGYVGALQTLRLDIEIFKHIAQQRPDYNLVLVGPEDDEFKQSELHQLSNVYFLGSRKPDELPNYINVFDICLNPQLVNEVTRGNYPRKIDEYLAMGKPVVATNTEAMEIFSPYTYLANNKEDYVVLIDKALKENDATKVSERKAFAATHTWENSANEIYKALTTVIR